MTKARRRLMAISSESIERIPLIRFAWHLIDGHEERARIYMRVRFAYAIRQPAQKH